MRIILKINEDNSIKLSLFDGKKEKDSLTWKENNSLSRILLGKIDQLLRRNSSGVDKISEYKIISGVPQKWTSVRIAKITFETLKLAKKTEL
jgi:hypothetical protein